MIVESSKSITEAWMAGTERLLAAGGDAFTSILCVSAPSEPDGAEFPARLLLDQVLRSRGMQDTQTVANTIFPQEIARNRTATQLYDVYLNRTYPIIRRLPPNRRGTYFLRLIHLPVRSANGQTETRNPLADCIAKMRAQMRRRGALRAAYELAVYRPETDRNVGMGFPCLSHVSLKLEPHTRKLHLTALYRNQFYFERAYGNLLGLARLQAFIAREIEFAPGELVCHATHAQLDVGRTVVEPLLRAMRQLLPTAAPDVASTGAAVRVGR